MSLESTSRDRQFQCFHIFIYYTLVKWGSLMRVMSVVELKIVVRADPVDPGFRLRMTRLAL